MNLFKWCGVLLAFNATTAFAQKPDARRFTFRATYIQPMSGPQTYLNSVDYTVSVSPDSIVCYLPYRGVAYAPPQDPRDGGIKFTSTSFTYSSKKKKNGREEITVVPKDNQQVQRLVFSLSSGGTAFLSITLTRAQPVSFTGELE